MTAGIIMYKTRGYVHCKTRGQQWCTHPLCRFVDLKAINEEDL